MCSIRTAQAVRKQDEMKSILGRRVFGKEEPASNGIRVKNSLSHGRIPGQQSFSLCDFITFYITLKLGKYVKL